VLYSLEIPPWTPDQEALIIQSPLPNPNGLAPRFSVTPPQEITVLITITITSTQIQYSQTVLLDFGGLSWPHVSVATLIPEKAVVVLPEAFATAVPAL
jgi:hypothetical protein